MSGTVRSEVSGEVSGTVRSAVSKEVSGTVWSEVSGEVSGTVRSFPLAAACLAALVQPLVFAQELDPARHDVVWSTPSADASGSMPLGNGDIALNAWVEPNGRLSFYIAKTDSWSENGRLLKVGRLRIETDPPLDTTTGFEWRLDLEAGAMVVHTGEGPDWVETRLWVDANHPVIQVTIDGVRPRSATLTIDPWRTERTPYPRGEVSDLLEDRSQPSQLHQPIFVEPDRLLEGLEGAVGWVHDNETSVGPALIAELQGLTEYFEGRPDPLLGRVFGALATAQGGARRDATHLDSPAATGHRFTVVVRTEVSSDTETWLANTRKVSAELEQLPFDGRQTAHELWWHDFWRRSWIDVRQVAAAEPVPANTHDVHVGTDQDGTNAFVGELGRMTILPRVASAGEIRDFVASRAPLLPSPPSEAPLFSTGQAQPGPIADSADWSFAAGLTIEAWLQPSALPPGGGRIVDKVTAGRADGFLFDTYPGNSLRWIVGSAELVVRDVLPTGEWVHVAATLDASSGELALFLDGREVARSAGEHLDDAATVSRAYALQRWVTACAGRGRYPIKFNGSLFTVPAEGKFGDADYRRWGPGYWWQNTRLPYLSLCASGDTELMRPLFRLYAEDLLDLHRFRTRKYTGHGGAFVPECLYFWGPTFTATYGWTPFAERGEDKLQESPWHKWEWVSGLELVWMMLDFAEHTGDEDFVRELLVPTARGILTFFDEHSPLDENGKLVMTPSQALETWWDCTNPMPEVAGLQAVTRRLLQLPETLASEDERDFWRRVQAETPPLPTWEKDGVLLLAPAERFEAKSNVENPELYAVFPFQLVSFAKSAELGRRTLAARWDRGSSGWRQDDLFMTHLGLAEEARVNLVARARAQHTGSRFPAFFGPNYDWVPDQDHGGVLMRTLQTMLMQTEGRTIYLTPAWPESWEADFRLHAPFQTTLTGKVRAGRIVDLVVDPPERRADVRM